MRVGRRHWCCLRRRRRRWKQTWRKSLLEVVVLAKELHVLEETCLLEKFAAERTRETLFVPISVHDVEDILVIDGQMTARTSRILTERGQRLGTIWSCCHLLLLLSLNLKIRRRSRLVFAAVGWAGSLFVVGATCWWTVRCQLYRRWHHVGVSRSKAL